MTHSSNILLSFSSSSTAVMAPQHLPNLSYRALTNSRCAHSKQFSRCRQRGRLETAALVATKMERLLRLSPSLHQIIHFSTSYPHIPNNQYAILKQIRHDLKEADVNKDGKIDFEELKMVLQKYPTFDFDAQEIEDIGELFFVGRSGGSVKHATFMRGIQHIIASKYQVENGDDEDSSNESKKNPLALESVEHQGCWVPSNDSHESLHNIQSEFESSMWKFVQEVHTLDQVGGKEAVERLSEEFYSRVTQDERLQQLFEGKSMAKLKKHPYNFMRIAFTASQEHSTAEERDKERIRKAHARLEREKGLNQGHFDLMLEHYVEVLQEDGNISEDVVDTAVDIVMTYRDCFVPVDEGS